jgi:hypothetical protein
LRRLASGCALAIAVATTLGVPLARADESPRDEASDLCFSAAERAQPLMREKRLREARSELETCARDECPRAARADCRGWLADVARQEPSIVISAHEIRGSLMHDLHGVRAIVDGTVAAESADDTPLVVDPGPHHLQLERPGAAPIERSIDVREGEKRRLVNVYWWAPAETSPSGARTPLAAYVLGGVGVVAVGAGTFLEVGGLVRRGELANCRKTRTCLQSDVDTAHHLALAGDASLGIGIALLAGALVLDLIRPATGPLQPNDTRGWIVGFADRSWLAGLQRVW